MRLAEGRSKSVGFHAPKGRMVFAPGLEGGHNFGSRWGNATFLYMPHFAVVIPCESALPCRAGKKRGDESPPPKWGGMRTRIAGIWGMPLSGPMRGRSRLHLSLREGSENAPLAAALTEGRRT